MKKLIFIFAILLTSCSSLQLEFATLNHVSNRARFTGFTQPQILNTNLFSINAPLTNGWLFNNNYGNSWQYFEFLQFQYQFNGWSIGNNWRFIDYAWTPNQFWRYPANRWAFDNWTYNIPPTIRRTPIRPRVQPVPYIREPRRERTRITNLDRDVRRLRTRGVSVNVIQNVTDGRRVLNNSPVRTQPAPQIRRQPTPTRTRTMNTQPEVKRRPVQTQPQTRVSTSNTRRGKSNIRQ